MYCFRILNLRTTVEANTSLQGTDFLHKCCVCIPMCKMDMYLYESTDLSWVDFEHVLNNKHLKN